MAAKLNREVIARAGLRLLEGSGIDGVTLRALASELGVQAPTLYWHVKSKQDIFKAMAVAISQDAAAATAAMNPEAPWGERLKGWAYAMRSSILSHRDGGRVFAGTFAADPATFAVTEAALSAWRDAGLSLEESAQRMFLLRHFIVGFCIEEQALAESGEKDDHAKREELPDALDAKSFPLTAQALRIVSGSGPDDRFELGLQLMPAHARMSSPTSSAQLLWVESFAESRVRARCQEADARQAWGQLSQRKSLYKTTPAVRRQWLVA